MLRPMPSYLLTYDLHGIQSMCQCVRNLNEMCNSHKLFAFPASWKLKNFAIRFKLMESFLIHRGEKKLPRNDLSSNNKTPRRLCNRSSDAKNLAPKAATMTWDSEIMSGVMKVNFSEMCRISISIQEPSG